MTALVRRWSLSTLRALLPSFVANVIWPEHQVTYKIHPTSYLDGLRGLASFIVFFCHYTEESHTYMVHSYGLNPPNEPSSWLQLPYARIIFSGRPMVHIFFVISGFVLSHKPLKAIQSHDLQKCYVTLSSSTFRRPFRLFGPCAVSTCIIVLLMRFGGLKDPGYLYHRKDTMWEQLQDWKEALIHQITWPWAWDDDLAPRYDVHLWTIPIEFVHSMLLFLTILALSRCRRLIRKLACIGLMGYMLCTGKWAAFEFLGGMFLAEAHVHRGGVKGDSLLDVSPVARSLRCLPFKAAFHIGLILVGLFIGGWPNVNAQSTPGIQFLLEHTPQPWFDLNQYSAQRLWFAISALLIVWSSGEVAAIKRFLEGPVAQYCGRLSYAIYICHGPVLNLFQFEVIGRPFGPQIGKPGDKDFRPGQSPTGVKGMVGVLGSTQRFICWLIGLFILGPPVVWAADVFWRLVDVPIINATRKLENLCLARSNDENGHAH